jgi:hypothetical protein
MKSISGLNKAGKSMTVKAGDRVKFDTNSNIGIREDVVRECFMQHDSLGNVFPAVVLTEHSWTPLSSILGVIPKSVQMHRTHKVDGVAVSFSRSIVGWVAAFGNHGCVHFRQPLKGGVWVARKPMALENICAAATLADAVRIVKARYDAWDRETEVKIAERLRGVA